HQKGAQVTASVSSHVPKPHTPFQWAAMDGEGEIARKQALLAERARALRVTLKMHENHQSYIEGIFARGDRRVADILERAFRLGCRFDGWDDELRLEHWETAIVESGVDVQRYLGTIPVTGRLPWDHIDIGLEPDFLAKEYRKALKDRLSPPCAKPYKKLLHPASVAEAEAGRDDKLICYSCGVACDLTAMKEERLYYLRRMNAWTKPVDPPPVERRAAGDAQDKRFAKQSPLSRQAQGIAYRYRLRYTKLGRVAYLAHLDLVRHLPRIFRRAGVELLYSTGFHPKPELSFGPALGLGIPSLGEFLDAKIAEPLLAAELVARLQAVSLPGIDWLAGSALGENDRALGRVLTRTEFWARLPARAETAGRGLAAWTAGEPLRVKRRGEGAGIGRMVDVRKAVLSLRLVTPGSPEDLRGRERLGWNEPADADCDICAFELIVSTEAGAKPREVVEAVWGAEVVAETAFARVALWSDDGERRLDPLDCEALRKANRPISQPPSAPAETATSPSPSAS
ncbi:MAG TPA: TIGR03936 family radical SAM-associated protein, partial [Polyangia bacterium]|nr:TIGR03936 family radical SAM-associated protein [Polyangia bacterium]